MPRPRLTAVEVELANNLVEDQNNDAMSYVDYVRILLADPALLCASRHLVGPDLGQVRGKRRLVALEGLFVAPRSSPMTKLASRCGVHQSAPSAIASSHAARRLSPSLTLYSGAA